jgi:hypothetical protein
LGGGVFAQRQRSHIPEQRMESSQQARITIARVTMPERKYNRLSFIGF